MTDKSTGNERILNSALALYSKYGLRSVTMDDLCSELGISKKTLYQYVRDKDDLVSKVLDYEKEMQRQNMEKMYSADLNAIDELIHVNRQIHQSQQIHSPTFYFDLKKYHSQIYTEWLNYKRERLYGLINRNLEKGIEEGLYRKEMDTTVISRLHMATTEMMHTTDFLGQEDIVTRSFIDEVFRYHIYGICNASGLEYFNKELNNNN